MIENRDFVGIAEAIPIDRSSKSNLSYCSSHKQTPADHTPFGRG